MAVVLMGFPSLAFYCIPDMRLSGIFTCNDKSDIENLILWLYIGSSGAYVTLVSKIP